MAIPYEKLVAEDLQRGYGTVPVTMPAGGSMPGTMVGLHTFFDTVHIKDFGGVPDGVTDTTPAFNAALAVVATKAGQGTAIRFAPGVYTFKSPPNVIPGGIALQGNASEASTPGYGTWLECAYNMTAGQAFLTWNGSLSFSAGGGLRDLCVNHSGGNLAPVTTGGIGVLLTGASDSNKADITFISNVGIGNNGSCGQWNKGLMIDGSLCANGVRSTFIEWVDISMCSDVDSNIYLKNAIHVHAVGIHLYPGASANCGMTITGNPAVLVSTNVEFAACDDEGNLTLDYCLDVVFMGRIGQNLTCTANSNAVSIYGGVHGTLDIAHSASIQVYGDTFAALQTVRPIFNPVNFPLLSGVMVLPPDVHGWDLWRAQALAGGLPLGFSATPTSGGSGAAYLGFNQNQDSTDNGATYYLTGFPAFRIGNPLGNSTYALYDYVAPAGTFSLPITYVRSRQVHATTGVQEFVQGLAAGDTAGAAFPHTILTGVAAVGGATPVGNLAVIGPTSLNVPGAAVGDVVHISHSGLVDGTFVPYGAVSAANTVKAYFLNVSGGSLGTSAGTVRADVTHHL